MKRRNWLRKLARKPKLPTAAEVARTPRLFFRASSRWSALAAAPRWLREDPDPSEPRIERWEDDPSYDSMNVNHLLISSIKFFLHAQSSSDSSAYNSRILWLFQKSRILRLVLESVQIQIILNNIQFDRKSAPDPCMTEQKRKRSEAELKVILFSISPRLPRSCSNSSASLTWVVIREREKSQSFRLTSSMALF